MGCTIVEMDDQCMGVRMRGKVQGICGNNHLEEACPVEFCTLLWYD